MNEAEKYINEYTRNCSNELVPSGYHEWLTPDNALRACEITEQETIEKVCEWLKQHSFDYLVRDMYDNWTYDDETMISDIRKAMGE